jgi:hypothetical protein
MQITELHFQRPFAFDFNVVKTKVRQILPSEVDFSEGSENCFLIVHNDYPVNYSDGQVPAQTAILPTDQPPQLESYQNEIQQSWRCRNAEALLGGCQTTLFVTEMLAQLLPPLDRLSLFHGVLRAMVEVTIPNAMVFKHSQQVIEPTDYLKTCSKVPILRSGSINVRFFKISNSEGDMIMDTRGLAEIGLHDLQCHFRKLNPTDVARVLFNTGVYIAENGPVIKSGETVEGIEQSSKWRCQFENSLLEPKREVLDLDPGEPYAAGNRSGTRT